MPLYGRVYHIARNLTYLLQRLERFVNMSL